MLNKQRRVPRTLATVGATAVLIASGSAAAISDEVASPDALRALEAVSSSSSEAETSLLEGVADVRTTEIGTTAIDSRLNDVQIAIPTDPSDGITLDFDGGAELAISLPGAGTADGAQVLDSGIVAFDSGTFTTVPVVKDDGSVQVATVLDGENAPSTYRYDIATTSGVSLEMDESGLVLIADDNGTYVGDVAPAWAQDADGRNVPTHYEVAGGTLTQVVDHIGGDFAYPIVADPWLGGNLFNNMVTGTDGGQPRYMLHRSTWGAVVSGYATATPIFLGAGWDEAKNRWPVLLSKETLHQQYDCHAFYATLKPDSWNLEKRRSNYPGWGSNALAHQCNW